MMAKSIDVGVGIRGERAKVRRARDRDPAVHEAFRVALESRNERADSAAMTVTQNHDVFDLQIQNRELDRRAHAVIHPAGLKRRNEVRDVTHDEEISWARRSNNRRIDARITASDDEGFRGLSRGELSVRRVRHIEIFLAEFTKSRNQADKFFAAHGFLCSRRPRGSHLHLPGPAIPVARRPASVTAASAA